MSVAKGCSAAHLRWRIRVASAGVPAVEGIIVEVAFDEAENFQRKDFTHPKAVAIKRALEPEINEAAKEHMSLGGKGVKVAQPLRAAQKVAAFTGFFARSLDKADAIVKAAESEPERFGMLVAVMDRTGRVDGPFKRLKVMKQVDLTGAK